MLVNEAIRQLTLQRAEASRIFQEALRGGMVTMQRDALQKVLAGVTSLQEVISKVGVTDTNDADALTLAA
jgi:type II secretory ATPase GspE/PulE/Tfp pilus assembly ATPase PilB-like protein